MSSAMKLHNNFNRRGMVTKQRESTSYKRGDVEGETEAR